MGHYRGEMGLEKEDARKAREHRERRKKMAQKIKRAIKKEGIEYVLADILEDPTLARIHLRE